MIAQVCHDFPDAGYVRLEFLLKKRIAETCKHWRYSKSNHVVTREDVELNEDEDDGYETGHQTPNIQSPASSNADSLDYGNDEIEDGLSTPDYDNWF